MLLPMTTGRAGARSALMGDLEALRGVTPQARRWNNHMGTPNRNDHMPSSDAGKARGPNSPKKNIAKLPKWMGIHIQ